MNFELARFWWKTARHGGGRSFTLPNGSLVRYGLSDEERANIIKAMP